MTLGFEDKVAIVTGGATGIGRAVSLALAARGAAVTVVYSKSADAARKTVDELSGVGGRGLALQADVTDEPAVCAVVDETIRAFGHLDCLVNNAATTAHLTFEDLDAIDDSLWDEVFATNVKGAFYFSRASAPHLRERPNSSIVNVGSTSGENGHGSCIPYAVSKSALHGLTKSLARALAPDVRVNCVAPGVVQTGWWKGREEKMPSFAGKLPLNRVSTPEDVADIALLLIESKSMTGQIVVGDNGQTL